MIILGLKLIIYVYYLFKMNLERLIFIMELVVIFRFVSILIYVWYNEVIYFLDFFSYFKNYFIGYIFNFFKF